VDACCEAKSGELAALRGRQARVLRIVLAVNAAMFGVEFVAGLLAGSTALLGDSLDMLGDALVYGFSLYVLDKGILWRTRASFVKGLVMLTFGLGVLVDAGAKLATGVVPAASAMAGVGAAALAANACCFALLWRHRADDLNLRSTWLCSRNDVLANAAVLVAAALVARVGSVWPDVLVGAAIACVFLRTAMLVLRESAAELAGARRAHGVG
jgi:cation diffusion facilitator family transporter